MPTLFILFILVLSLVALYRHLRQDSCVRCGQCQAKPKVRR